MEDNGDSALSSMAAMKKRRSAGSRRPRVDVQFAVEGRDVSPSSTPSSGNGSKVSSDENVGHESGFRKREFHLNSAITKVDSANRANGAGPSKKVKKEGRKSGHLDGLYRNDSSKNLSGGSEQEGNDSDLQQRCSEGVLSPANWKAEGSSGVPAENKFRKVKLKVGGITHTIHANSNLDSGKGIDSSTKESHYLDSPRNSQKIVLRVNSDDNHLAPEQGISSQRSSWRDARGGFSNELEELSPTRVTEKTCISKPSEPIRKSKRVPKRRFLDGEFDDIDEYKMHYVERQKASKVTKDHGPEYEDDGEVRLNKKLLNASKRRKGDYDVGDNYVLQSLRDSRKRSRKVRRTVDADYIEDEDPGSDAGSERLKKKLESVEASTDFRVEPLTKRQRSLQSNKDGGGSSLIEFPDGLPPAPSRRKKQKLSDIELQAKKAEAAQRRKMLVEKANRELQAATISKILGHDPEKKRKEEEKLKELDGKTRGNAGLPTLLPDDVRWIIGPAGTIVTFGEGVGLPSIFGRKPCSYPPPREKCSAPSCSNPYKYRDSKFDTPLCSLQCYRTIQGLSQQS